LPIASQVAAESIPTISNSKTGSGSDLRVIV